MDEEETNTNNSVEHLASSPGQIFSLTKRTNENGSAKKGPGIYCKGDLLPFAMILQNLGNPFTLEYLFVIIISPYIHVKMAL